jgi:hypothetical protein
LHAAQVVSLHCNLDDATFHLMNEDRLNMMKKDAVLVNAARGPVIDERALTAFLQANENFRRACPFTPMHTILSLSCTPVWRWRGHVPLHAILLHLSLALTATPSCRPTRTPGAPL